MEIESILEGNNLTFTSASFLSTAVQSVQRAEFISRQLRAGGIHSYLCLPRLLLQLWWNLIYHSKAGMKKLEFNLQGLKVLGGGGKKERKKRSVFKLLSFEKVCSFIFQILSSNTSMYVCSHEKSGLPLEDTDRKSLHNIDMNLFAGLCSWKAKSGMLEYDNSHVDAFCNISFLSSMG